MLTIQEAINKNKIAANGLPLWCFVQKPAPGGEVVIIDFPVHGYSKLELPVLWDWAQKINREMGVTEKMEEAMLAGSMFGFHVPAAQVKP